MGEEGKKSGGRFSLRLPPDVETEVRALARGNGTRPPAGINETILFLLREGLKAQKKDKESGNGALALVEQSRCLVA